jgi:hypothetical protein
MLGNVIQNDLGLGVGFCGGCLVGHDPTCDTHTQHRWGTRNTIRLSKGLRKREGGPQRTQELFCAVFFRPTCMRQKKTTTSQLTSTNLHHHGLGFACVQGSAPGQKYDVRVYVPAVARLLFVVCCLSRDISLDSPCQSIHPHLFIPFGASGSSQGYLPLLPLHRPNLPPNQLQR